MEKLTKELLSFSAGHLFLGGEKIFSIPPQNKTMMDITAVGFWEPTKDSWYSTIYVGSGTCCHGHLYTLILRKEGCFLHNIFSVDINVRDILPVWLSSDGLGITVVGQGCSGAGVRFFEGDFRPRFMDIFSQEQYEGYVPHGKTAAPLFSVEKEGGGTICINFHKTGWQRKSGTTRNPDLPSIIADSQAEEFVVSPDLWGVADITPNLIDAGVDIDKTMTHLERYCVLRR